MAKNYDVDPSVQLFRSDRSDKVSYNSVIRLDRWLNDRGLRLANVSRQILAPFMQGVTSTRESRITLWRTLSGFFDFAERHDLVQEPSLQWLVDAPEPATIITDWLLFWDEAGDEAGIALGEGAFTYFLELGVRIADLTWAHLATYFRSSPDLRTPANWPRLKRLHLYLCYQGYVLDTKVVSRKVPPTEGGETQTLLASVVDDLPAAMRTYLSQWLETEHALSTTLYRRREALAVARFLRWLDAQSIDVDAVTLDDLDQYFSRVDVSLSPAGAVRRFLAFQGNEGVKSVSLQESRSSTLSDLQYVSEYSRDQLEQALTQGLARALGTNNRHRVGRLRGAVLARVIYETGHQLLPLLRVAPSDVSVTGTGFVVLVGRERLSVQLTEAASDALRVWIEETSSSPRSEFLFRIAPDQSMQVGKAVRGSCVVTTIGNESVRVSVNSLAAFGREASNRDHQK